MGLIIETSIISFIMYMIYLAGAKQVINELFSLSVIAFIFIIMPPQVKVLMVLGFVVYGVLSVVFSEDD